MSGESVEASVIDACGRGRIVSQFGPFYDIACRAGYLFDDESVPLSVQQGPVGVESDGVDKDWGG